MHEFLATGAEYIAYLANLLAIIAIAIGCIEGAIGFARHLLTGGTERELRPVWLNFGRWLVLGLTFQLASDIVETTIAPGWEDIGKLGAIAVIRTFLNFFLDRDMDTLRERAKEEKEEAAAAAAERVA